MTLDKVACDDGYALYRWIGGVQRHASSKAERRTLVLLRVEGVVIAVALSCSTHEQLRLQCEMSTSPGPARW